MAQGAQSSRPSRRGARNLPRKALCYKRIKHTPFPHAKACGPIEASHATNISANRDRSFRTQKRAAPLKPAQLAAIDASASCFRTQKRAAPLKQRHLARCPVAGDGFRTQKRAAPLKRRRQQERAKTYFRFPHAKACGPIEAPVSLSMTEIEARCFRTQKRAAPLKHPTLFDASARHPVSARKSVRPH